MTEARGKEQSDLLSCDTCMTETSPELRCVMHCGHCSAEAHADGARWQPDGGGDLTTCAGYTCSLPEVVDVACSSPHWEAGALPLVCPDGAPTALLHGLAILKGARGGLETFRMREAAEKQAKR